MARSAESVALVVGPRRFTFRELDHRAGRVATALARRSIGRGDLVGVSLPRGPWLVPAILGILRSGAAYVPLDPAYPADRLRLMTDDCALPAVVCDATTSAKVARPVLVEDLPDEPVGTVAGDPGDTAYVLYTSGSTGTPKGVPLSHRNAMAFLDWAVAAFTPEERAGTLAGASVSFDFSILELFAPLLGGGTVFLAESVFALPDLAARDEIRMICGPPSALGVLLSRPLPPGVRTVVSGGETLPPSLVEKVFAQPSVERVVNLYGPTEATTAVLADDLRRAEARRVPTLGRPIAGAVLELRDPAGAPADEGELWIGGPGVGPGYLNRPDLTRERFVASWYRTGDQLRRAGDRYQFVGRRDDQVKVRGFRVEPGEVEAALAAHPRVRTAVVVAPVDAYGTRTLVGYVAGDADEDALLAYLRERLPAYMVPERIGVLDRLPLSPTGKVDRAALPALAEREPSAAEPGTDVEAGIAALASDLLGRPVGPDDRFTDRGGHSLAAARLLASVAEAYGVSVPLGAFLAAPTVADLARAVVSSHRDRPGAGTVVDLGRAVASAHRGRPALVRRPGTRIPLTDQQRLFWGLRQVTATPWATSVAFRLRLSVPADRSAVGRALSAIVARHEVLRTRFVEPSYGEIAEPVAVPVHEGPLSEFLTTPFDPTSDVPLLRALVTGLDELVIAVDHIAFDGVSMGLLMAELAAELAGVAVEPPPLQVGDVAHATAEAADDGFWSSTLDGVRPPYDLSSRPRTAPSRHAGGRVVTPIDADLAAALDAFTGTRGVSAYSVWAAALAVVLDSATGRPDALIGVAAADRDRPGLDRLIGPLIDVLPVRVRWDADLSFLDLARRAADATHAALAHRAVPVSALAALAGTERPVGAGLTPVVLSVQPPDVPVRVTRGDVTVSLLGELDTSASQSELTVYVNATVAGPALHLEYDGDRFDPEEARSLADRLLRVVRQGVAEPDRAVSAIDLVDRAGRAWVLSAGDGGPVPAGFPTVVHAIAHRAAQAPDAIAVEGPDGRLTYAELVARADRVAAHLVERGAAGQLVGVTLPRDHRLPATLLGVLRAGAAYVPLEPDLPPERLRNLAADAGVTVILDGDVPDAPPVRLPDPPPPEATAYVLYTSGSTGAPKGVEVTHANLAAFVASVGVVPGYGPDDVVLAVAPLSFDLSGLEIWAALALGARTVVVTRETAVDGPALARRIETTGVTAMLVTPTTLRLLLAGGWRGGPHVRVIAAGEVLDAGLADQVNAIVGALYNGYGPTEATVLVTCHPIPPGVGDPVPIGGPTPGDRLYLLDRSGRLAPPGAVADLYIGGAGVARGYRHRPELTAAAFTDDPFVPGGRLYRTGDLARWRPDATLEYLGRRDAQVKVRGYRIELTEIEAVLREHPLLVDAAVTVVGAGTPAAYLAGYLVWRDAVEPDVTEVAGHARDRLPAYMVPVRWLAVSELPRTPNGKTDRRALPAPPADSLSAEPETETQKYLAELWADILGVDHAGAGDDFFRLGGNSLAATRLVTRIRHELDCDLPVAAVFENPRLSDLAERLEHLLLSDLGA